jgi:hypothetical protein
MPNDLVIKLAQVMKKEDVGAVPIVENSRPGSWLEW